MLSSPEHEHDGSKQPRKRRKLVKSCTFCRKRKLKCDHKKPMCQQCKIRKLPECIYIDGYNYQITTDDLFKDLPNIELVKKIKELEEVVSKLENEKGDLLLNIDNLNKNDNGVDKDQQQLTPNSIITGSVTNSITFDNSDDRNLLSYFTSNRWQNNQNTIFGPTSWRTLVTADSEKFQLEFMKLFEKIQPSPLKFKHVIADPVTSVNSGITKVSIFNDLPKFNDIKLCIDHYFNGPIHELFSILDYEKTIKDLNTCFLKNSLTDKITNIVTPSGDTNFYKSGIILMIVCICYYTYKIPLSVQNFINTLAGRSSSNINFVERAQFLCLRCFFEIYHNQYSLWDGSQSVDIVAELCQCCITLGLNDVNKFYKGKEYLVGNLNSLRNTFHWACFADISVSFDMGKSLFINENVFCSSDYYIDENLEPKIIRKCRLMRRFFSIVRPCLNDVNGVKKFTKSIDSYVEEIEIFVNEEFSPIENYTKFGALFNNDIFDVMLLSMCLGLLFNLENIKRSFFKDMTFKTKNSLHKYGLLSLSLCVNTIRSMYCADKKIYPTCTQNPTRLSPYVNITLLLVNPLFVRVLSETYSIFLARLTLTEHGYLLLECDSKKNISLNDLHVDTDDYYSFAILYQEFRNIIDQLFHPDCHELRVILGTSYPFLSILALERVGHVLFDKGLESRTETESSWHKQGVDLNNVSDNILNTFTDEVWNNYTTQANSVWRMEPEDILFEEIRERNRTK